MPKPQFVSKKAGWSNSVHTGGLTTLGFVELQNDLLDMASRLSEEQGAQWPKTSARILNEAAQPVLEAAQRFVHHRSNTLSDALKVGKVVKRKGGGYTISIGSHKEDDAFYAGMVEFGHGGPSPAGPTPFMRPAYDTTHDQAYDIIREGLTAEINKLGG